MMMQKLLLSNRCKMSLHRELKQMQAYELIVGKNGPKLKESAPEATVQEAKSPAPLGPFWTQKGFRSFPRVRVGKRQFMGERACKCSSRTMDQLASRISKPNAICP